MPSLGRAHCFIAVFIVPTVHSCSKFMFWAEAGKRGQGRVGKRWEDSCTSPLSFLLGSCGSLVSLTLSHESIPGEYSHGSEFSPFVPFFLAWALCLSWPSLTPPPSQSVVFPLARKKEERERKTRRPTIIDLDVSSKQRRCQDKGKRWQFRDLIHKVFRLYLIQKVLRTHSIQGALTSEIKRRWN